MDPKTFPEVDPKTLTPGNDMDLPVIFANSPTGLTQIISCWHVTDEDLERIKETREIWLSCFGAMVPVAVSTEKPFAPIKATDDEFPDLIDD